MTDLVLSEGFHSRLGMPVCSGDVRRGTLCLYWDNIIAYREDPVPRALVLADALGKHLSLNSPESSAASQAPA